MKENHYKTIDTQFMQNNKPKRVRSAVFFRPSSAPKAKLSIQSAKTYQKQCQNEGVTDFGNLKPVTMIYKISKQGEFRSTIKKLPTNQSKKIPLTQAGFTQYNSQSWRTIHSAKSLTRLQSLKRCREKDPIKINLQQKVMRIKSKHKETQVLLSARTQKAHQNIELKMKASKKVDGDLISKQINQIIKNWQRQKMNSVQVYRTKVELLTQFSQKKMGFFKPRVPQSEINWQIC